MIPLGLFPVMQCITAAAGDDRLPMRNLLLDLAPFAPPSRATTAIEIGEINLRFSEGRHHTLTPPLVARFYNHMATGQIFEDFGKGFPAVECRCNLLCIGTRKLKENMRAHRKNR